MLIIVNGQILNIKSCHLVAVSATCNKVLHYWSQVKKFVEIFLGCFFIASNVAFYTTLHDNEKIMCRIRIPPFPGLLELSGKIFYQVKQLLDTCINDVV